MKIKFKMTKDFTPAETLSGSQRVKPDRRWHSKEVCFFFFFFAYLHYRQVIILKGALFQGPSPLNVIKSNWLSVCPLLRSACSSASKSLPVSRKLVQVKVKPASCRRPETSEIRSFHAHWRRLIIALSNPSILKLFPRQVGARSDNISWIIHLKILEASRSKAR